MPLDFENLSIEHKYLQGKLFQTVKAGAFEHTSLFSLKFPGGGTGRQNLAKTWTQHELQRSIDTPTRGALNVLDLFCGGGGLSMGIKLALKSLGIGTRHVYACDGSASALQVYAKNHSPFQAKSENVNNLVQFSRVLDLDGLDVPDLSHARLTEHLTQYIGQTDMLVAGPPCEGNSNLNNRTRREDPRNELYVITVSIGILLGVKAMIIENVPTVRNAKQQVVPRSIRLLEHHGYQVFNSHKVLAAREHLVAQTRKRHFLIAVREDCWNGEPDLDDHPGIMFDDLSVWDVIGDLRDSHRGKSESPMDRLGKLDAENVRRIKYLYDHKLHDLPNSERPYCHREKEHNYHSVYGRMYRNEPAPTLSTGFLSPGRGRYIHPTQRRCLTLREGARIQGFPDYYEWFVGPTSTRTSVARHIGDAVPPNLGKAACLIAMSKMKRWD